MENAIDTCKNKISRIFTLVDSLNDAYPEILTAKDHLHREALLDDVEKFNILSSSNEIKNALIHADNISTHAQSIGMRIVKEVEINKVTSIGYEIMSLASDLKTDVELSLELLNAAQTLHDPQLKNPRLADFSKITRTLASKYETQFSLMRNKLKSEIESYEKAINSGSNEINNIKQNSLEMFQNAKTEISELMQKMEQLKHETSNLQEQMIIESKKASDIFESATDSAKDAQEKIDKLLETTASKVLLLEYSTTADDEESAANKMRNISLGCMALTGAVLLFALYETLNSELDWKQSVFKMFIALALSVPAAYLARESAKHRTQQHISRRIALDLKAVTPYIASLPSEDQIKIKSEVASRIFGVHNNDNPSESWPLNLQEIIQSLIEKIPTKKD
ncbi:hypothetical protein GHN92_09145 [Pseudomonas sp. FSL R10-2964]|uniref:hypothetical protein n=1 Tax=Pseudomonas sp. FSL R10-2964 TaxID=2662202 RepID=UPI001297237C|nr:hypothetical protein [Pseudomonas sp. FSL R10-2964]MQT84733.1 hypothetical protein [Pseudomonas sp. FSL R10-2964]